VVDLLISKTQARHLRPINKSTSHQIIQFSVTGLPLARQPPIMRICGPGTNGASFFNFARGAWKKADVFLFVNENLFPQHAHRAIQLATLAG
jgi:hypothetical protein